MIKHIVGFIIFTFVIGTSALIAALFNPVQQNVSSVRVSNDYTVYKSRKRCRKKKKRKPKRPRILLNQFEYWDAQAVYDAKSNLLTTANVGDNPEFETDSDRFLVYHIYAKNQAGARHLTSVQVNSGFASSSKITWVDSSRQLAGNENLYLIPQFKNRRYSSDEAPTFNEHLAIPVLIKNRK